MTPQFLAKRTLAVAHDLVAVVVCWFAAYWLRFNPDFPLHVISNDRH